MDKLSWNTIADKFITSFKGIDSFRIKNKNNPLLFSYKQKDFYVFFRNISHGGGDYPEGTTRVQLPEKAEFDLVKKSNIPFFLMGYDQNDDVFVCWEPQKVKKRLNEKGYVSFFARKNVQNITSNRYIVFSTLSNGDFFVAVKTADIPKFFDLTDFFPPKEPFNKETEEKRLLPSKFTPSQIIYYGVPGCGKSYKVNKDINDKLDKYGITDREYHKVRCVFHPEYCNADFVGQIYPCVLPDNKGVEYKFKPGPFSEIVRRAYLNPDEPFFLIIEEINRGNAAAIFGEMFQLLDRIKKGEPADESTENKYDSGWSSYGVDNQDINADIRDFQKLKNEQTKNKHSVEAKGSGTDINPKCYSCIDVQSNDGSVFHFSTNTAIRLPPNLSIYATMNTSDQNLFTMDNAFQRRFKFKMIENELDDAAQYDIIIGKGEESEVSTGVRWGSFRNWINKKILSQKGILSKSEDKCLGGWFISTDALKVDENKKVVEYENISREDFAEKVLKYLWYDVFRRNSATEVFNEPDVTENKDLVSFAKFAKEFKSKDNVGFDAFKKIFKDIEKDKDDLTKTYTESKVNP